MMSDHTNTCFPDDFTPWHLCGSVPLLPKADTLKKLIDHEFQRAPQFQLVYKFIGSLDARFVDPVDGKFNVCLLTRTNLAVRVFRLKVSSSSPILKYFSGAQLNVSVPQPYSLK